MEFALTVLRFCRTIPDTPEGRHVRGRLFRAGTGVAANYRAACRGKSRAGFVAKLGTVIEEADESDFWLELAVRAAILKSDAAKPLRTEAGELIAIFTQSQKNRPCKLVAPGASCCRRPGLIRRWIALPGLLIMIATS
jgi:four helix bundle protein